MRWIHPAHSGRAVRLAYCMNLHPGETLEQIRRGMEDITLPLRDRLAGGGTFGVGVWLPAGVALELASPGGRRALGELGEFLGGEGLDPFTFNAFPYGGFHRPGLKAGVYRPTWSEPEREGYTVAVARVAAGLMGMGGGESGDGPGHVSISTHSGSYGPWVRTSQELRACAEGLARAVGALVELGRGGPRMVLSLEAEPWANAPDNAALAEFLVLARDRTRAHLMGALGVEPERAVDLAAGHLGTCLDCCHSAVQFEDPARALALAGEGGVLGKIQFSSAVALTDPADRPAGRAALLAMDEPCFLHQVTGHGDSGHCEASDLPDLARALEEDDSEWLACDEWRCHFHVPVDLEQVEGLETTRAHANAVLAAALADPGGWTTDELHVEIETYTWDVLPDATRGSGALVDGLEREYGHVIGLLEGAGWRRV